VTDLARAVQLLRQGRLVAFPTETVYGLGADATNPNAIDLIYRTKGRPGTNPLIIHVADVPTARRYAARWPAAAEELAARFWPGPLTIVLPKAPVIPANATAGLDTVALRVPNHPLALELLRAVDGPLAAPSANRSTRVSPTTAQHVRDEFPGSPEPALILDGGPCTVGIESTVLDLTTTPPTILRPGHVTAGDFEPILGPVRTAAAAADPAQPAASPGQQEIHYAPRAAAYRYDAGAARDVFGSVAAAPAADAVLAIDSDALRGQFPADHPLVRQRRIIAMPADPARYASVLYGTLREVDDRGATTIWVEFPPDDPAWGAVRDRLRRATRPR
jgi:L-threonylcarbamoyladenylate synthase